MVGGNWQHVQQRIRERIPAAEHELLGKALRGLVERMKVRRDLPNKPWWRPVRQGKTTVGFICGQGLWVSTVYGPKMTPRGTQI